MKKTLILFGMILSLGAQANECDLSVNSVKLSAKERKSLQEKGFILIDKETFSASDVGTLALIGKESSNGISVGERDFSVEKFKFVTFWNYSEVQAPDQSLMKYLNYVARNRSLKSVDSCSSIIKSLDKIMHKIARTQMYPRTDDQHGILFIE